MAKSSEAMLAKGEIVSLQKGIAKLEKRISELAEIDVMAIEDFWASARSTAARLNSTFLEVFGKGSIEFERSQVEASRFRPMIGGRRRSRTEDIQAYQKGVGRTVTLIKAEIDILMERLSELPEETSVSGKEVPSASSTFDEREVFIVHGQSNAEKQEVARFVQACGLEPRILHELENRGDTIIEKLERHASRIGFAIVLLTPDDEGGPKGGPAKPRARQNVVAELFYFIGKIGRKRVVALKKGDVEVPSDIAGVVYIELDRKGSWKVDLVKELKAAGYAGTWEKAVFG